jgi:hypothetical protein
MNGTQTAGRRTRWGIRAIRILLVSLICFVLLLLNPSGNVAAFESISTVKDEQTVHEYEGKLRTDIQSNWN